MINGENIETPDILSVRGFFVSELSLFIWIRSLGGNKSGVNPCKTAYFREAIGGMDYIRYDYPI